MKVEGSAFTVQIIIIVVASLLFIPFLGGVHLFDWDEINFAECAREMLISNDFLSVQMNFQPFWEKPPLFIWFQALSMKLFGINEFAARFPNSVCGIVTLLSIFRIGTRMYSQRFGIIWTMAYLGSFLPFLYFKSGIIDPWFNLFIFLGIVYFVRFTDKNETKVKWSFLIFSAAFIGLAVLTKGPVALLVFLLSGLVFLISNHFYLKINIKQILVYILVVTIIGGAWFIVQIIYGQFDTVIEFIVYQIRLLSTEDAGHGGFFLYHFVVLFFGVFPASIFAIKGFRRDTFDSLSQRYFRKWMLMLFWVVLVLFSWVQTKIVHYSSLCYFPLTYFAAYAICRMDKKRIKWSNWITALLIAVGTLYSILSITISQIDNFKGQIIDSGLIKDDFALGNLMANAGWKGFEWIPGAWLFIAVAIVLMVIKSNLPYKRAFSLFVVNLVFTFFFLVMFVPRIEAYSQNAAIEFYKEHMDCDCYIQEMYFKSYAPFFYAQKKPGSNPKHHDKNWLLTGNIDKDVFFVTKVHRAKKFKEYEDIKEIGRKNGFVFLKRNAKK